MTNYRLDLEKYAALARQTVAEGCVLLKNDNNALPIKGAEKVGVFGRNAFYYYKSGLGSGGLVNTRYVVSILDALKASDEINLDNTSLEIYEKWLIENPVDKGKGWGQVPWSQKEMPVTDELIVAAKAVDVALICIGRTAGEDQDNTDKEGSYRLSFDEENLIKNVAAVNKKTVVILNTGNIIDMSWVKKYSPASVLYVWQGGQEGGNGVLDVLTGVVNPCGKLTDTIAENISDYPSTADFGDKEKNFYTEDIYVGYRYFETFNKKSVVYPFGFGLSYSTFDITADLSGNNDDAIEITAKVKNTGSFAGKEVVQVYIEAPQGKLGKPSRSLVGFAKTGVIEPQGVEELEISVPKYYISSYDDSGVTGHKNAYVLEEGVYSVYVGSDVRSAALSAEYNEELRVLKQLSEQLAPKESFERIKPVVNIDGSFTTIKEAVPVTEHMTTRRDTTLEMPEYTGDKGIKLLDVYKKKATLDDFVAQISDEELIKIFRGEGMCSPKVTPGIAAAFGGLTKGLQAFGIPAAGCSDGPSGIRMDCGTKAFAMPNGEALGSTFNTELVGKLYEMEGLELRLNKIDSLLGPGMNIHRNPLNGRNFEYISEDPVLTGMICAAQIEGMAKYGIGSTVKHFCGNNQEIGRSTSDSIMSERALREIYLKGFEIVAITSPLRSVMTTYGSVNGKWTAGSYDLCTGILRKEWGFEGIVMTDWWAVANYDGQPSARVARTPMILAQNDIYMVSPDAEDMEQDDVMENYKNGVITRAELSRNACNILGFILKSPAMLRVAGEITKDEEEAIAAMHEDEPNPNDLETFYLNEETNEIIIPGEKLHPAAHESDIFGIYTNKFGKFTISLYMSAELDHLAQLPVSIFSDNFLKASISIQGTEGKEVVETRTLDDGFFGSNHYIKFYYGADGLKISKAVIKLEKEIDPKNI